MRCNRADGHNTDCGTLGRTVEDAIRAIPVTCRSGCKRGVSLVVARSFLPLHKTPTTLPTPTLPSPFLLIMLMLTWVEQCSQEEQRAQKPHLCCSAPFCKSRVATVQLGRSLPRVLTQCSGPVWKEHKFRWRMRIDEGEGVEECGKI